MTIKDNLFEEIKTETLSENVINKILDLIKSGEINPGDKLPSERELARDLGISRAPLREALRSLSNLGFVKTIQGDGTYVTKPDTDTIIAHFDYIFSLDKATFEDLFEARKIIETSAIGLAAQRISEPQLEKLRDIIQNVLNSVEDLDENIKWDLELHNLIAEASQNKIIISFFYSISKLSQASRLKTAEDPNVRRKSAKDHIKLLQMLEKHDVEGAKAIMEEHLKHVENAFKEIK